MGVRFKADELKEMIRSLVRQEIKSVVSETINEVLSERYLKEVARRMVESASAVSRPRGVASLEIMGDDAVEEEPPHALAQDNKWPFQKHPMKHDDEVNESEDPMAIFFEGTKPIPVSNESLNERAEEALKTPEAQDQIAVWKKLNEGMERSAASKRPVSVPVSLEEAEKRLAEKRARLEYKP